MSEELSYEWQPFNGDYVKTMQDVMLVGGTVVEMCWPNAGVFMVCNENNAPDIQLNQVQYVRKNKKFYRG